MEQCLYIFALKGTSNIRFLHDVLDIWWQEYVGTKVTTHMIHEVATQQEWSDLYRALNLKATIPNQTTYVDDTNNAVVTTVLLDDSVYFAKPSENNTFKSVIKNYKEHSGKQIEFVNSYVFEPDNIYFDLIRFLNEVPMKII